MKATELTILDFMRGNNKTYVIPPFQRNYSWEETQCATLFNDICSLYEKWNDLKNKIEEESDQEKIDEMEVKLEKNIHYLGTILWYEGKNNKSLYDECIIVDGQQRLTSVLLLICAIRDIIEDEQKKKSISSKFLCNELNDDNQYSVRLKQSEYDDECFRKIVENIPLSELNLKNNVNKMYEKFKDLLENGEIPPEDILELLNYVKIVGINLEKASLGWIQTVFEKINSTGTDLTSADLIRNYLLISTNNAEQTKLYNDYWVKIEENVRNENIQDFIVIYLIICTCKANETSETKLYNQFKEHFKIEDVSPYNNKQKEKESIMKDMLKLSEYYACFKFDKCKNEKIRRSISYIKELKAKNFSSVCVYCLSKMSGENEKEMEKIFELFTDFIIRYRIVSPAGGSGGAFNSVISELLKGLKNADEKIKAGETITEEDEKSGEYVQLTRDSILHKLSNSTSPLGRFPTNDEFKAKLMKSETTDFRKVLFMRMEDVNNFFDFTKNIAEASVEHLMPQSVTKDNNNARKWQEYLGGTDNTNRICDEYINCIGNLALLPKKLNTSISNKIWSEKINTLKEYNNISTINGIADEYPNFRESDIQKRNERMAQLACESITKPLDRDIPYKYNDDFVFLSSVYVSGKTIDLLMYNDEEIYAVSSSQGIKGKEFLTAVCKQVYEIVPDKFNEVCQGNNCYAKKNTLLLSKEQKEQYTLIENSDCYVYIGRRLAVNTAWKYAKSIVEVCGLNPDAFKVKYKTDSDDE